MAVRRQPAFYGVEGKSEGKIIYRIILFYSLNFLASIQKSCLPARRPPPPPTAAAAAVRTPIDRCGDMNCGDATGSLPSGCEDPPGASRLKLSHQQFFKRFSSFTSYLPKE